MIFILTSLINLSIGEQELFPFFVWDSGHNPDTIFQVINEPCDVLACDHQPLPLFCYISPGEGLNTRIGCGLMMSKLLFLSENTLRSFTFATWQKFVLTVKP